MLLIYLYRLPLSATILILFLITDSYINLYPLYQALHEKTILAKKLLHQYQLYHQEQRTAKLQLEQKKLSDLTPYHTNDWLPDLTKIIISSSLKIKKIQLTPNTLKHSYATTWQVLLSGDAKQLLLFLTKLHRDFPWITIHEPLFTLNHQEQLIDVSLQLLALTRRPTQFPKITPTKNIALKTLPFCQSNQASGMQDNSMKNKISFIESKRRKIVFNM